MEESQAQHRSFMISYVFVAKRRGSLEGPVGGGGVCMAPKGKAPQLPRGAALENRIYWIS